MRHCKCGHVPERLDQFIEKLGVTGIVSEAALSHIRAFHAEVWGRGPAPPPNRLHDRALAHVTAPDHHGHQRWTGPMPIHAGPHVTLDGRRMPVAHWLWLRAGGLDLAIERTCRDPQCIAPSHHRPAAPAPSPDRMHALSRELAEFDARFPRVNPKPKSWDKTSDLTQERCKAFGHPLKVYNPQRRDTYCADCFAYETRRKRERAEIERRADWNINVGTPYKASDYLPEGDVSAVIDTRSFDEQLDEIFHAQP